MVITAVAVENGELEEVLRYLTTKLWVFENLVKKRKGVYKRPEKVLEWIDKFLTVWNAIRYVWNAIRYRSLFSNAMIEKVAEIKQLKWRMITEAREKFFSE